MPSPKTVTAQRDFSGGELDVSMKRTDADLMKIGARQLSNFRILNSKVVQNRPGRTVLFLETGRTDEVLMSPGNKFFLVFGNGYLRVYNAAGAQVFTSSVKGDGTTAIPWTGTTAKSVVWAVSGLAVYITYADGFPTNVPQVLTWDGVSQTSTWTLATFAETITAGGQKRTPFYRISPPNITLNPSAASGNINIVFSAPVLVAGHVGTRMTFCGRQIIITAINTVGGATAGTTGKATVAEPLPPGEFLAVTNQVGSFVVGDVLLGASSGAKGIVTSSGNTQTLTVQNTQSGQFQVGGTVTGSVNGNGIVTSVSNIIASQGFLQEQLVITITGAHFFAATETITMTGQTSGTVVTGAGGSSLAVQILPQLGFAKTFSGSEIVVGPSGQALTTSIQVTNPQPVSIWADEVMNTLRGYPASVFFDQNRLGFCNFTDVQSGIVWSAVGLPTDLYADSEQPIVTPDSAIFELAPGKSQVYFVLPGPESGEFVFCDNRVYYIPITVQNPLIPGSVAFNILSSDGAANVQPRAVEEIIFYVSAGGLRVKAVIAPGAYYRPFNTTDVTENHTHLFTNVIALAAPTSDGTFPERYVYALNSGGSLVVGKYVVHDGQLAGVVGWAPWSGTGTIGWVSSLAADVLFWAAYAPNNITPVNVIEILDDTQYLDAAIAVNNVPTALTPPGGKGPLWWLPSGSVTLMDQSTRMMGTYLIDANGNIIAQGNGGENLTIASLVAGQQWTATLEPFIPSAQPGQDIAQRMTRRRVSRAIAYVANSTGFLFARLFSGPVTRTSPALGAVMNNWRVTTWNQDDDATKAPPLREGSSFWRPLGRNYDPRIAIIKDTPGPIEVLEIGTEVSV